MATHPLIDHLIVVRGLHCGAEAPLPAGALLVGAADDCDIVLRDASVAQRHLLLMIDAAGASVRGLGAGVCVDDAPLAPGATRPLVIGTRVTLGDAALAFGQSDDAPWREAMLATVDALRGEPLPSAAEAEPPPLHGATASGADGESHARVKRRRDARWGWVGVGLGLGVATGVMLLLLQLSGVGAVSPASISALLHEAGFDQVSVEAKLLGGVILRGRVDDDAQRAELARLMAAHRTRAEIDVVTGDRLAQQVRDLFRVSGFNVEARYTAAGGVEVERPAVAGGGPRSPDEAMRRAQADLRAIAPVVWAGGEATSVAPVAPGAPVPAATGTGASGAPVRGAGDDAKRLVAVVDGPAAHVVTRDGTRYFIGALLPQGQRIVAIDGATVTVEREGGGTLTISF